MFTPRIDQLTRSKTSPKPSSEMKARVRALVSKLSEETIDHFLNGVLYIFDFTTHKYVYVSSNLISITGYKREDVYRDGVHSTMNRIHPDDQRLLSEEAAPVLLNRIRTLSDSELQSTRFRYSYRFLRSDDTYVHIMTYMTILMRDERGMPLLSAGTLSDINDFKKDNIIRLHAISHADPNSSYHTPELLYESAEKLPVTYREKEVIRFIADGLSNEEISKHMHISVFTVRAHRRNILHKTKCDTFNQVISKALENNWI